MIKSVIPYSYEIDKLQKYKTKPKSFLPEREILNYNISGFSKPKSKKIIPIKKTYNNIDILSNKRKLKAPTLRYKKPDLESFKISNLIKPYIPEKEGKSTPLFNQKPEQLSVFLQSEIQVPKRDPITNKIIKDRNNRVILENISISDLFRSREGLYEMLNSINNTTQKMGQSSILIMKYLLNKLFNNLTDIELEETFNKLIELEPIKTKDLNFIKNLTYNFPFILKKSQMNKYGFKTNLFLFLKLSSKYYKKPELTIDETQNIMNFNILPFDYRNKDIDIPNIINDINNEEKYLDEIKENDYKVIINVLSTIKIKDYKKVQRNRYLIIDNDNLKGLNILIDDLLSEISTQIIIKKNIAPNDFLYGIHHALLNITNLNDNLINRIINNLQYKDYEMDEKSNDYTFQNMINIAIKNVGKIFLINKYENMKKILYDENERKFKIEYEMIPRKDNSISIIKAEKDLITNTINLKVGIYKNQYNKIQKFRRDMNTDEIKDQKLDIELDNNFFGNISNEMNKNLNEFELNEALITLLSNKKIISRHKNNNNVFREYLIIEEEKEVEKHFNDLFSSNKITESFIDAIYILNKAYIDEHNKEKEKFKKLLKLAENKILDDEKKEIDLLPINNEMNNFINKIIKNEELLKNDYDNKLSDFLYVYPIINKIGIGFGAHFGRLVFNRRVFDKYKKGSVNLKDLLYRRFIVDLVLLRLYQLLYNKGINGNFGHVDLYKKKIYNLNDFKTYVLLNELRITRRKTKLL